MSASGPSGPLVNDFIDEIQKTSICLTPDAKFSLRSLLNMYMMYVYENQLNLS